MLLNNYTFIVNKYIIRYCSIHPILITFIFNIYSSIPSVFNKLINSKLKAKLLTTTVYLCHQLQRLVLGAWLLPLLCCLPQMLIFTTAPHLGCDTRRIFEKCETNFPNWLTPSQYTLFFSFANFFIPLIVLFICNIFICKTIWTSSSNM